MGLLEQRHRGDTGGQVLEGADEADGLLGGGDEFQSQLGDDTQGALGADHQVEQGVAGGGLGDGGAEVDHLAGGQNHGHGPDIVTGGTVLDSTHAAGVGGDVAAQSGELLSGIGGIHQTLSQGVLGQIIQQYTGLNTDHEVFVVIFQNLLHAHGAQHHAAGDGSTAAHQAGARAAGGDGDIVLVADLHDAGDFLSAQHVDGHLGHFCAIDGHLVTGVVGVDVPAHDHAIAGHLFQFCNDLGSNLVVSCHNSIPPNL